MLTDSMSSKCIIPQGKPASHNTEEQQVGGSRSANRYSLKNPSPGDFSNFYSWGDCKVALEKP